MLDFSVNWLAILVAMLLSMVVGALWYSKVLFMKPWMEANGFKEDMEGGNPAMYVVPALSAFIQAFVFANLQVAFDVSSLVEALLLAALMWVVFVFFPFAINNLFSMRDWRLIFIDSGQYFVIFLIASGLVYLWV